MGYSGYDYDEFQRKKRGEPRYPPGTERVRTMFGNDNWPYRALYVVLHLGVLVMLIATPTSVWHPGAEVMLAFFSMTAAILFFVLQGSDPGYVEAPIDHVPADNVMDEAVQDEIETGMYGPNSAAMQPIDASEGTVDIVRTFRPAIHRQRSPPAHHRVRPTSKLNRTCFPLAFQESGEEESMLEWDSFPPMRTIYCKAKEKYVAKFDHFCMFLNTPIGEKNHCLFWRFLLFEVRYRSFVRSHEFARSLARSLVRHC